MDLSGESWGCGEPQTCLQGLVVNGFCPMNLREEFASKEKPENTSQFVKKGCLWNLATSELHNLIILSYLQTFKVSTKQPHGTNPGRRSPAGREETPHRKQALDIF